VVEGVESPDPQPARTKARLNKRTIENNLILMNASVLIFYQPVTNKNPPHQIGRGGLTRLQPHPTSFSAEESYNSAFWLTPESTQQAVLRRVHTGLLSESE